MSLKTLGENVTHLKVGDFLVEHLGWVKTCNAFSKVTPVSSDSGDTSGLRVFVAPKLIEL